MNESNQSKRSHSSTSVSTKVSQRPGSRASTESIQSFDQRTLLQRQHVQNQHHNNAQIFAYNVPQPNPELSELESALLQISGVPRPIEQSNGMLDAPMSQHHMQTHGQTLQQPHTSFDMNHSMTPNNSFTQHRQSLSQSTLFDASVPQDTDASKRKGGSATATNDRELRELLNRNEARSLKDVAGEVIATERTPRAERTKQLFAMLWLKATCRKAKTSVPRNRVYSYYASRCGTERVVPLNPASFGKLVRIIFPGIATRRLGVRGESKYHYVDLALVEDEQHMGQIVPEPIVPTKARSLSDDRSRQASMSNPPAFPSYPRLTADTAVFPTQEQPLNSPSLQLTTETVKPSQSRVYAEPNAPWFRGTSNTSQMYSQHLKFPPTDEILDESDSVELPNIQSHLPPKTDIDAINNLLACYRSHCTSLIDCIRFCKEKQFFRLFTSFHGTLTVPAQKLFANPSMAPWIKECDWMMYQKMIRFVSQLTLQVVPPVVLKFLDAIDKGLHAHICKVFQGFPLHVLEAKLEPATLFANLLHRMLRANQTAHAAAALLIIDQNRDQMWQDWVTYVNPKRIMESELPGCGYEEVFSILTRDVKNILQPLNIPNWLENATNSQNLDDGSLNGLNTNETIIDRISQFLYALPTKFPRTDTRTLLCCISNITTAAIREITVENGVSFGAWWITKVFVDEMSLWLASLGGFLDHQPPTPPSYTPQMEPIRDVQFANGEGNSQHDSRFGSLGDTFAPNTSFMSSTEEPSQASLRPAGESEWGNLIGLSHSHTRPRQPLTDSSHVANTQQPPQIGAHGHPDTTFDENFDDSAIGMSGFLDDPTIDSKPSRPPAMHSNPGFNVHSHIIRAG